MGGLGLRGHESTLDCGEVNWIEKLPFESTRLFENLTVPQDAKIVVEMRRVATRRDKLDIFSDDCFWSRCSIMVLACMSCGCRMTMVLGMYLASFLLACWVPTYLRTYPTSQPTILVSLATYTCHEPVHRPRYGVSQHPMSPSI